MKIFSRQDLRNQLRQKKIEPVYLLFGSETYLRSLAAKAITEIVLKEAQLRDFNESEISLETSSVAGVLAAADQVPMIDAKRLIRVTDVAVSAVKSKDSIKEEDEEILKKYLLDPSGSTVLIFIADEIDKRRKISKLLFSNCFSVEFNRLSETELIGWAKDKLREMGSSAEDRVIRHLVNLIGDDVRKLTIELEKLATAALPNKEIGYDLVESLAPNSREISNFDLVDKLLSNNRSTALHIMKKILDDGAEPVMLLGLLSYNFRRLFWTKELMEEGADEKQISNIVKLPWKGKTEFLQTARRTDKERFSRILKRIADTDLAIKTSVGNPRLQIEMLIIELSGA
ncbi:MAG: DNA polymerase III subunit delta [Acidobacteria bacterium]|nr:DNA polymerase III subunit delta [Acidobacteriota bacterium]